MLISKIIILLSFVYLLSYFFFKKLNSKSINTDYSFLSRFLHHVALRYKLFAEISFEVDNRFAKKNELKISNKPVFISGLARSGTTILMRHIYETGQFRSLTYNDMPFILMPFLWKKLSLQKESREPKERAHQDGIMVNFESPEAFEEVFWRVFCGNQYIRKDRLELQKSEEYVLKKFKDYIRNIIFSSENPKQNRYLSKNNNNILRMSALLKSFPYAKIIIPFREPMQHALSLLNQHQHFSEVQTTNRFTLDYMNWLGHFEFGLNQKPFHFGENDTFNKIIKADKGSLNFWLLSWKNYYSYALDNSGESTLFFSYEEFCKSPNMVISILFKEIEINTAIKDFDSFKPSEKRNNEYDKELLEDCQKLYLNLLKRFNLWYTPNKQEKC